MHRYLTVGILLLCAIHSAASDDCCRASSQSYSRARMLIPIGAFIRNAGRLVAVRATQTSSSGGSNETEVNELIVSPIGLFPQQAVMMVTPLGNAPAVFFREAASTGPPRVHWPVSSSSLINSPAVLFELSIISVQSPLMTRAT